MNLTNTCLTSQHSRRVLANAFALWSTATCPPAKSSLGVLCKHPGALWVNTLLFCVPLPGAVRWGEEEAVWCVWWGGVEGWAPEFPWRHLLTVRRFCHFEFFHRALILWSLGMHLVWVDSVLKPLTWSGGSDAKWHEGYEEIRRYSTCCSSSLSGVCWSFLQEQRMETSVVFSYTLVFLSKEISSRHPLLLPWVAVFLVRIPFRN